MHHLHKPALIAVEGGSTISFLPKNKTLTRIKIVKLWKWQWRIKRAIRVEYSICDRKLHVSYRCPNGHRLFMDTQKDKAEDWIGGKIKISPLVGQVIISKQLACISRISCPHCHHHTLKFPNNINVLGTIGQITKHISISKPEWERKCEKCLRQAKVTLETTQQ